MKNGFLTIGKTNPLFTTLVDLQAPLGSHPIHSLALWRGRGYNAEALNLGFIDRDGSQTHPKIINKLIMCPCSFQEKEL